MPHIFEKRKLRIPTAPRLDRRVKLTAEQREAIRENKLRLSNKALARKYGVSKRLIQFIRNPDALLENIKRRRERREEFGVTYYDKDQHRISMQRHRVHKKELFRQGKLEG